MEQELGDNVTLQEIEVVSTQNITTVKCPMIFKIFLFKRYLFFIKKKKDICFVMRLDGYQTIYHFAILEGM